MVEIKSNLLTAYIIVGFTVLLGFFAYSFTTTTQETARETVREVNQTSDKVILIISNLTTAINDLANLKAQELQTFRSGFYNLTALMYEQVTLFQKQDNETKENLRLFFDAMNKSAQSTNDAIQDLNKDSNASREKQTEVFVETLGLSQNLTKESQNLTKERNDIEVAQTQAEREQTEKIDGLIQALNLTLTFPPNTQQTN